ncbi:MAG: tripartite tricarboxylate transporter TctB family protein [Candidatus Rokuibacteriota bacterium]
MKLSDTLVGAGFAGAGALIFAATLSFPPGDAGQPGPALFPRIVGVLMGGFGATLAVRGFRAGAVGERIAWRRLPRSVGFVNALFVTGAVLAYVVLAGRLGFLLVSTLILFVLMWRLGVSLLRAGVVAVLFTVFVYLLFYKLLRVPLPAGLVWW